jgi:hypothetical protein
MNFSFFRVQALGKIKKGIDDQDSALIINASIWQRKTGNYN